MTEPEIITTCTFGLGCLLGIVLGAIAGVFSEGHHWKSKLRHRGLITLRKDGKWKWAGSRETVE